MMRHTLSTLSGVIVAIGVTGAVAAQPLSSAPSQGATLLAQAPEDNMGRCQQLYGIWARHNGTSGYGRVLEADMALEHCRKGEFSVGVAQLKRALQRQQLPIPPVESAATR